MIFSKYHLVFLLLAIAIRAQISNFEGFAISNRASVASFLQKDEQNISDTDSDASKAEKGIESESSDETEELDEGEISTGTDSESNSDIPEKIDAFLQLQAFIDLNS